MTKDYTGSAQRPRAMPLVLIAVLLSLFLAGCAIGPLDLGGGSGPPATATSTGPTASPTLAPRALSGRVQDVLTGSPIANAEVTAGGVLTATAADGMFYFEDVPAGGKVVADAEGYSSVEMDTGAVAQIDIKLRPSILTGKIVDATDNKPLVGVLVKLVLPEAPVPADESVTATETLTATTPISPTATAEASGFGKGLAAPEGFSVVALASPSRTAAATPKTKTTVSPATATRKVPTSTPVPPTATPTSPPEAPTGPGFLAVYTDQNGSYTFKDVPPGASLTLKMPGYKLSKLQLDDATQKDVALERFKAEAIYITDNIAASTDLFDNLIEFVQGSRINAVVINVQSDASEWAFDVKNPDAIEAGNVDVYLEHMPKIVADLRAKGIYTIARVVTFQQKTMAEARPEWAVKSSTTGKAWKGGYGGQQKWLDASNPEAQDHLIAMTKEVLDLGFDEIQYDYVRFPSDAAPSETGDMVFSRPLTDTTKALALQEFLKKAHAVIEPTDAFMSIDVFGYTLWPDREEGPILGVIGQVIETMIDHTDYICPMIYPSHFSPGEQGCKNPASCAYILVKQSGIYAAERFEGKRAKYRPWLQDFDWGVVDYTSPGTKKVIEQIQAAEETNTWGWQMWDPANVYSPRSAFRKP
ncbi:MAG: putative glycoside hydrolase [Chloroflexia bacterium]